MKTGVRKTLSLLLSLAMLFGIMQFGSVNSFAATGTDFTIVNGVLIKYNGSASKVSIPSTVTSIDAYAFNECSDILQILIPKSVTSIGRYAFEQCTSLTKITIPDSVTVIENYAFDQCTDLKTVILPNNIKSVGIRTFNECTSLTQITIPNSVTSIGNYAFNDCTSLKTAIISSGVKSIGLGAFYDCDHVTVNGYQNTAIQTYATKNNIPFQSLGYGTIALDTKSYVMAPKNSYTVGVKLIGSGLTLKVISSKTNVAKVVYVSTGVYKVTGVKAGTTYITFTVYDKSNKQLASTSAKITVKKGAASAGTLSKQVIKF